MTSPVGLKTVTVNIVPPDGISTSNFTISAVSTVPLKWGATGDKIDMFITKTPGLGLTLPAVDQVGFVTLPGSPFQGWQYVITIAGSVGGVRFDESYLYEVKSSQTEVDLNVLDHPGSPLGNGGEVIVPPETDRTYYTQLARTPDVLISGNITRDANDAATSAPIKWPDGTVGTYTALVLSSAFPGAVDSYKVTYGSPVTKTYTQPTVTRGASGAATVVPAIVVT